MFEPGSKKRVLQRVNKHCTLKYVAIVKEALGSDFKKIEDSFLGLIIQMGMRNNAMVFSRNLIHELLLRRIKVGKKNLWFSFGEQLMRKEFTANQKLRLGATILVESILIANNPVNKIPVEKLLRARNFEEFCKYPWGNETYDALRAAVEKIETTDLVKVTKIAENKKVVAKCILGDQELHSNLVEEDVDTEFGKVVDLVKRGYRLKRQDWRSGSVNIAVAEAEIEENNYGPGSDATDKEKIEFLTKQLEIYNKKKWRSLKIVWAFVEKPRMKLMSFMRLLKVPQKPRKMISIRKGNWRRMNKKTQDKEEQLVDNDADDSEKERETSKDKEGQIEEAERNGEVAISGERSETSKDNEKDEEVNEDASKEPEQVADSGEESETSKDDEKDEEVNEDASKEHEQDRMEEVEEVNEDTTNICKEVKNKKPRKRGTPMRNLSTMLAPPNPKNTTYGCFC
ncbi:Uncharacterized protein Rs2_52243 [Raphanus sativus]|nr:Uncharacterized protein Rs2_52243 [Raphanus sativus]